MEQSKPFRPPDSPPTDFDSVCRNVRAALEPARVHALSLHDETGDVLWLTEGSMGPDEHNAVREALEAFAKPNGPMVLTYDLGDAKSAVLLRAVNSRRALVGAVMAVMDTRLLTRDEKGVLKILTPKLQRAIADYAVQRADVAPASAATPARPAGPPPSGTPPNASRAAPPAAASRVAPPPAGRSLPAAAPAASAAAENALADALLSLAPDQPRVPPGPALPARTTPPSPPRPGAGPAPAAVPPEVDRLNAALRRTPIALFVQRLIPLTKGSQLKRYEVLLRTKSDLAPNVAPAAMLKAAVENGLGSMIDRRVVTELIGWLLHHPEVWTKNAVLFSVNLTTTALHDEHFVKFVELCLAKSALPKAMIGFEIDVMSAVQLGARTNGIAESLHRLGCPLVLDDFGLRTECFELLRLPGVRYVKLASGVTAKMRSDKLSQAAITAVVQMARVLGMHTVAKRTETAAEQEWLTALGVDFIQSNALSPPASIDALARKAKPPTA